MTQTCEKGTYNTEAYYNSPLYATKLTIKGQMSKDSNFVNSNGENPKKSALNVKNDSNGVFLEPKFDSNGGKSKKFIEKKSLSIRMC